MIPTNRIQLVCSATNLENIVCVLLCFTLLVLGGMLAPFVLCFVLFLFALFVSARFVLLCFVMFLFALFVFARLKLA